MNSVGLLVLGVCLAIGLASAGYFGSQTIVNGRTAVNTATVKGLAEQIVNADTATWKLAFFANENGIESPDVDALFDRSESRRDAIVEVLQEAGFQTEEFFIAPLQYRTRENRDFEGHYVDTTYTVSGWISVSTDEFDRLNNAYFAMADLPRRGVPVTVNPPNYLFTELNDIKPEMLRVATENARIAADEFAKNAGVKVGGIQTATQGGFSVRDIDGHSDSSDLEKLVRVVTTITFYLEN